MEVVAGERAEADGDGHEERSRSRRGRLSEVVRSVSLVEAGLLLWFTWSVWRIKWLSDDGYIYLTYVRNLTENGWGPVLNRGERVEGFTSPAWYALLSAMNVLRPDAVLDMRQAVILVSMVLSIAAAASWVVVERRAAALVAMTAGDVEGASDVSNRSDRWLRPQRYLNLPLAVLAAWYPLHSFATSGLETPLQLLVTMAVIVYVWSDTDNDWTVGVLAATLPLVRPELGLVSLLLLARHAWRRRWLRAVIPIGIFVAVNLGALCVRIAVYGQVLPNTYYAKTDTDHGVGSGLDYLADLAIPYGLHWIAAAAVLMVLLPIVEGVPGRLDPVTARRSWFLLAAGLLTLYVVAIGGDFMHARFLLSEVLLLAAVFAGAGTAAAGRMSVSVRRRALVAAAVTVLLLVVTASTEPLQTTLPVEAGGRPAKFHDISDEALAYRFRNADLHAWEQSGFDPWIHEGERARRLAELLGTEIGVTRGGIGHFSFQGQAEAGRVYTYDVLGLTRLDVARLDMLGADLRVGHAKVAPDVLIAANPRVDLHAPYFEGWADVARFEYEGGTFVILDPDLVDPLVGAGVMSPAAAERLRTFILDRLAASQIDRNFVTFLTMRYHRDDAVLRRVREIAELDEQSAWRGWLDDTADTRALLEPNGCSGWSFFECLAKSFDRHGADSIPDLPNEPDWADRP